MITEEEEDILDLRAAFESSNKDEEQKKKVHNKKQRNQNGQNSSKGNIYDNNNKKKKDNLIEIQQLIDLTDKPIRLTRDEIGWSKVRCNASNCICCCCNNTITLVTTDDSYALDHIPLDNIQYAQTSPNLQYLALSNHRKLAIINLVDNNIEQQQANHSKQQTTNGQHQSRTDNVTKRLKSETKFVNMAAMGLTMNDVIFWRWLDNNTLALLSHESLYTCLINQTHINHPAFTALSNRSQLLMMDRVCDIDQHLSTLCQVTDIQRDSSANLYAISGLYSTMDQPFLRPQNQQVNRNQASQQTSTFSANLHLPASRLKQSFGSVPSRLSQLVGNDSSLDSIKPDQSFDLSRLVRASSSTSTSSAAYNGRNNHDDGSANVDGLVQVYCKIRDRAQIIRAQTMTFTSIEKPINTSRSDSPDSSNTSSPTMSSTTTTTTIATTTLIAARRTANRLKVHFIGMSTTEEHATSGQAASPSTEFNCLDGRDFPTSIVCCSDIFTSTNNNQNRELHLAMITTKYGQLFVCSIAHSTILFSTRIADDIISSTILEDKTGGLMAICRNGQVILVKLNADKLIRLLDETKRLRHISSSQNLLTTSHVTTSSLPSSTSVYRKTRVVSPTNNNNNDDDDDPKLSRTSSVDIGMEILISTKL